VPNSSCQSPVGEGAAELLVLVEVCSVNTPVPRPVPVAASRAAISSANVPFGLAYGAAVT